MPKFPLGLLHTAQMFCCRMTAATTDGCELKPRQEQHLLDLHSVSPLESLRNPDQVVEGLLRCDGLDT